MGDVEQWTLFGVPIEWTDVRLPDHVIWLTEWAEYASDLLGLPGNLIAVLKEFTGWCDG